MCVRLCVGVDGLGRMKSVESRVDRSIDIATHPRKHNTTHDINQPHVRAAAAAHAAGRVVEGDGDKRSRALQQADEEEEQHAHKPTPCRRGGGVAKARHPIPVVV